MRSTKTTSGSPPTQTANKRMETTNSISTGKNKALRTVAVLLSRFDINLPGGYGYVSS